MKLIRTTVTFQRFEIRDDIEDPCCEEMAARTATHVPGIMYDKWNFCAFCGTEIEKCSGPPEIRHDS